MRREFHAPERKLRVGVLGATGMAGQRFLTILEQHPWFEVMALAVSPRSAGKTYEEAIDDHWKLDIPMPERYKKMVIHNVNEVEQVAREVDFASSAVDMTKEEIRAIEDAYAKHGTPVVSSNSAYRWTPDAPMVIPEVNSEYFEIVAAQRKHLGTERGFVAVKPNYSTQSHAPVSAAWKEFEPHKAVATTYQAISGAGKNFKDWSETVGNIIPYTGGEEEKSEEEPLRVYEHIEGDHIELVTESRISSQCIRMPVLNGHTTAVFVRFRKKPMKEQPLEKFAAFSGLSQEMKLPSAPQQFIRYMEEENRPQAVFDVNYEGGMGISIGRLREDAIYDWKFVGLSHNTLCDTAGGVVERAETLTAFGYIVAK